MWTNVLLMVSAGTTALKLTIEHWISVEEAAVYVVAAALFSAATTVFKSPESWRKVRAAKVLGAVASLAISVGNGNLQLAAICAVASIGIGIMGFGLVYMIAGSRDKGAVLFAGTLLAVAVVWWVAEEIKRQSSTDTISVAAILGILQERAFPQRTISLRIPAHGVSQVVSTHPRYRIISWDLDEMRGIGMLYVSGQQIFNCDDPWPAMTNNSEKTYQFYFKSCRDSETTLTLRLE